jgi:hypothetical protein
MRPFTVNGLVLLGIIPTVLGAAGAANRPNSFGRGVWLGLAVTGLWVSLSYAYSLAFERKHPSEPLEFWIRKEATSRPRLFLGSRAVLVTGVGGLFAALDERHWMFAGFVVFPSLAAAFLVAAMWGKVP